MISFIAALAVRFFATRIGRYVLIGVAIAITVWLALYRRDRRVRADAVRDMAEGWQAAMQERREAVRGGMEDLRSVTTPEDRLERLRRNDGEWG